MESSGGKENIEKNWKSERVPEFGGATFLPKDQWDGKVKLIGDMVHRILWTLTEHDRKEELAPRRGQS